MKDQIPPKGFKLPSFKDVQEQAAERARSGTLARSGFAAPAQLPGQSEVRTSSARMQHDAKPPARGRDAESFPGAQHMSGRPGGGPATAPVGSSRPTAELTGSSHSAVDRATASAAMPSPLEAPQMLPPHTQAGGSRKGTAQGAAARALPADRSYSAQVGHGNALLVNKNQNGNPVLRCIHNVNYRFADIIPDFQFNDRTAAVFLSLKFHRLQPTYVYARIRALQRAFRTFLLCRCDVADPEGPLATVAKAALDLHATLLVAFTDAEGARYLELLKAFESRPADSLMPRVEGDHLSRYTHVLTVVRAVNKTDSASLGAAFGSMSALFRASEDALAAVPGLGPTKVARLQNAFTAPFLRETGAAAQSDAEKRSPLGDGVGESEVEARERVATQQVAADEIESDGDDFVGFGEG